MVQSEDEGPAEQLPVPGARTSAVRQYLEDKNQFVWHDGNTDYTFSNKDQPPLLWKRKLDPRGKSKAAFIDEYEFSDSDSYRKFTYTFAVKQILDSTDLESRKKARTEVQNMQELRHPHICILLGTYLHRDRLHIMIYPAASCDLGDLMSDISKEYLPLAHLGSENINPDRIINNVESREIPSSSYLGTQDTRGKLIALKSYFVCLCQALTYLHSNDIRVRHKDIKPENALIDWKGYVILTDFGISKKFEKNTTHVTSDGTVRTERYMSPEMAQGQSRNDLDDIFMLGCVFLEMASVLLGHPCESVRNRFSRQVNVTGINENYCSNLDKLTPWCLELQSPVSRGFLTAKEVEPIPACLEVIKAMMSESPSERPPSEGLWKQFDFVDQPPCRDCHPDHHDAQQLCQFLKDQSKSTRRRSVINTIDETLSDTNIFGNIILPESRDGQRSTRYLKPDSPPPSPRATGSRLGGVRRSYSGRSPPRSGSPLLDVPAESSHRHSLRRSTLDVPVELSKHGHSLRRRTQSAESYNVIQPPVNSPQQNKSRWSSSSNPGDAYQHVKFSEEISTESPRIVEHPPPAASSSPIIEPAKGTHSDNQSPPQGRDSPTKFKKSGTNRSDSTTNSQDSNKSKSKKKSLEKIHKVVSSSRHGPFGPSASNSQTGLPAPASISHGEKSTRENSQSGSKAPVQRGPKYLGDSLKQLNLGTDDKVIWYNVKQNKTCEIPLWGLKGRWFPKTIQENDVYALNRSKSYPSV